MTIRKPVTLEEIPLGSPRLKTFAQFPWQLYRGDSCWTPPLMGDLLGSKILGLKGLLTREHPYHRHAEVTHFIAWQNGKPAGRISAAINHEYNQHYRTTTGFFGFFEVINDYEIARTLLDSARKWVKERGMTVLRGPGEYSNATHERQGILIEGFQYPPTTDLTHNPPYYAQFLDQYGFRKAKDYVAYYFDRKNAKIDLVKRLARLAKSQVGNVETRAIRIKDLREEVRLILNIYNEAWAQNWGFLPISDAEGDSIANSLRFIIDPGLARFAYIDGEPVAVMGVIPDPNYALRPLWKWYGDSDLVRVIRLFRIRRHIPRTRGMFFGIKPKYRNLGLPALLANEIADYLLPLHYQEWDASLILEDNHGILKVIDAFGGTYYKKWRIYDLPL
jgi:hypothetical protein